MDSEPNTSFSTQPEQEISVAKCQGSGSGRVPSIKLDILHICVSLYYFSLPLFHPFPAQTYPFFFLPYIYIYIYIFSRSRNPAEQGGPRSANATSGSISIAEGAVAPNALMSSVLVAVLRHITKVENM